MTAVVTLLVASASRVPLAAAQSAEPRYVATQWTIDDGLPVNSVNDITQTDDGYLWLATYDGLVRFDGLDFTVYQSGHYERLPSSRITDLYSPPGELWLRTESRHLVRFHRGRFHVLNDDGDIGDVFVVHRGRRDTLWVGTSTGVYFYRNGHLEPVAPKVVSAEVHALLDASDGSLWVGTRGEGLFRRRPDGTWTQLTRNDGLAQNTVFRLLESPSGSVWIGAYPHVQRWRNGRLETIAHRSSSPSSVHGLVQGPEDDPWMVTSQGLHRFRNGEFVRMDHFGRVQRTSRYYETDRFQSGNYVNTGHTVFRNGTPIHRLEDAIIQTLYSDEQGNLWLGTKTEGFFRVQRAPVTVYGESEGLPDEHVYPITQRHDGSIWLGTFGGGLAEIRDGNLTAYAPNPESNIPLYISALHEDHSGTFWVGSTTLCRFEQGRCIEPQTPLPRRATRIRAIFEDRAGRLWIGSENGLFRRSNASDPSLPWKAFTPRNSSLPHSFVRLIRETPDGHLWFATNGGGIAHYSDGVFVPLTEADGLPSNLVREIHRDSSGVFWIGTEDNGLARLVLPEHSSAPASVREAFSQAEITRMNEEHGLFDDVIHRILEEGERMWMSTNRGIFWVQKSQLDAFARGTRSEVQSVSYTTRSGMRSREANGGVQPAGIQADDGRLWFPTQGGAVVIDPDAVHRGMGPAPPTVIERLTVDGRPLRPDTVETLTLGPGVNEIAIHYTALEFSNPHNVQFRYRLEDLTSSWSEAGTRRTAYFTNVSPDTYRFVVTARGATSSWNSRPARLSFTIEPFFYQTTWFYVLCALLFGLGAYGLVRYRTYVHRQRAEKLDRLVEERTQQLQHAQKMETVGTLAGGIAHDFNNILHAVLAYVRMAKDDLPDNPTIYSFLSRAETGLQRAESLVDKLLTFSRQEVKSTEKRVNVSEIVRESVDLVSSSISNHVQVRLATEDNCYVIGDPGQIQQVAMNLLTNAAQAMEESPPVEEHVLDVEVQSSDVGEELATRYLNLEPGCYVRLTVGDTGPGMDSETKERIFEPFFTTKQENKGTGLGLSVVHGIVQSHNGEITVRSEPGVGTTFTVYLPASVENPVDADPETVHSPV